MFLLVVVLLLSGKHVSKKLAFAAGVIGVVNLVLSQSRTSFFAFAASLAGARPARQRLLVMSGIVLFAILTFIVVQSVPYAADRLAAAVSRSGGTSEIFTLTGRTKIWSYVWNKWLESPRIGFGYASTKTFMVQEFFSAWWWTTSSAHNSILQSLVTVGLVGTAFVIVAWGAQLVQLVKDPDPTRDSIFLFVIVGGLTEAGAIGSTPNLLTLFWLLGMFWRLGRSAPLDALGAIVPSSSLRISRTQLTPGRVSQ